MIKNIAITLLVVISFSCSFLIRPKGTYTIENRTSKDMKIEYFSKSKLLDRIIIKNKSSFDTTKTFQRGVDNTPFDFTIIDSINVEFSDLKSIRYYCNGEPVLSCSFNKIPIFFEKTKANRRNSKTTWVFIFDESDYVNAKPL